MEPRTVCAVLPVTNQSQVKLAKKAVDIFIKQHYLPVQLIVVNNTSDAIINRDVEQLLPEGIRIREINNVPVNATRSQLYNIGILSTEAEWILPLSVNIYSHPSRLLYQLAHTPDGAVSCLRYQMCLDISKLDEHKETGFIPDLFFMYAPADTILFPRIHAGEISLYDERLGWNESNELLHRLSRKIPVVNIDNAHTRLISGLNWPALSITFFHSMFPRTDIPKQDEELIKLKQSLNMHDYSLLYSVLASLGFQVKNGLV